MRKLRAFLAAGISVLCLTGCTPLFFADFEDDTAFQPPDLTPSGAPANDEIELSGGSGAVFEARPNALDGDLSFRIEAAPNDEARAVMHADGIGAPDRPIIVSYTGRITPRSHGEINFSTGGPFFAVQITFLDGQITANGLPVGSYVEGGQHTMVLSLFPNTDTFSLGFTGQVLVGDGITGPLIDPDSFPGSDYSLHVDARPTQEGSVFIVDNVLIGSRN